MAEENKNKTSKGWISRALNYIKNIPQEIKSAPDEEKQCGGRIGIVCGLIALSNSFNVSSRLVCINLGLAIALAALGVWIAWTLKNQKLFWSGIVITGSFAFVCCIIRIKPFTPIINYVLIAIAVIAIVLGFCSYFRDKVHSRSKEQRQGTV
jgi:hypothetical protein